MRVAIVLLFVAAPLAAQRAPADSTPAQRDTVAIRAAARAWARPYMTDSGSVAPRVLLRGDTAHVTVRLDRTTGLDVRLERRHGRWVALGSDALRIR